MILKTLSAAEGASSQPLADWAYVTPLHQDGLKAGALSLAVWQVQRQTAQFWFLLNYAPLGGSAGYGAGSGGYGSGMGYAPERWPASEILAEEFGGVIADTVLTTLADEFSGIAGLWVLRQPTGIKFSIPPSQSDVEAALVRLADAVAALTEARPGIGHNEGPSLVDVAVTIEIRDAAQFGIGAVRTGSAGEKEAVRANEHLRKLYALLGAGGLPGSGRKSARLSTLTRSMLPCACYHTCMTRSPP